MLAEIGIGSVAELFADIPTEVRFKGRLSLPEALSEAELLTHLRELADLNADLDRYTCFMGGGATIDSSRQPWRACRSSEL